MFSVRIFVSSKSNFRQVYFVRRYCSCQDSLSDAYKTLGINDTNCSDEDVKEAYIVQARRYHPDNKSPEVDAVKFSESKEAYTKIMSYRKLRNGTSSTSVPDTIDSDFYDFDNKYAVPQHRRYLTFEGIGSGNPSQRQKQYQHARVMIANSHVNQYRIDKMTSESNMSLEAALLDKDIKASKKIKTTNLIDRLVEDLIQEAMVKGEFENLRGSGKPLPSKEHMFNPYIDSSTLNINRVLIENGYMPEWVNQEKSIRTDYQKAADKLKSTRMRLGNFPFSNHDELRKWNAAVLLFGKEIEDINKRIDRYNLITPTLFQQKPHFKTDYVVSRIENDNSMAYSWKVTDEVNISHGNKNSLMDSLSSVKSTSSGEVFKEFMKELMNIFKFRRH